MQTFDFLDPKLTAEQLEQLSRDPRYHRAILRHPACPAALRKEISLAKAKRQENFRFQPQTEPLNSGFDIIDAQAVTDNLLPTGAIVSPTSLAAESAIQPCFFPEEIDRTVVREVTGVQEMKTGELAEIEETVFAPGMDVTVTKEPDTLQYLQLEQTRMATGQKPENIVEVKSLGKVASAELMALVNLKPDLS